MNMAHIKGEYPCETEVSNHGKNIKPWEKYQNILQQKKKHIITGISRQYHDGVFLLTCLLIASSRHTFLTILVLPPMVSVRKRQKKSNKENLEDIYKKHKLPQTYTVPEHLPCQRASFLFSISILSRTWTPRPFTCSSFYQSSHKIVIDQQPVNQQKQQSNQLQH